VARKVFHVFDIFIMEERKNTMAVICEYHDHYSLTP
jgi:hypothetical protein